MASINSSSTSPSSELFGITTTTVANNDTSNGILNGNWSFPHLTTDGEDFFHHLTLKDETTFVALIVMGILVPAIFITVFILICRQRRKDVMARRAQMLLQNAQDFSLDDFPIQQKMPPPRM